MAQGGLGTTEDLLGLGIDESGEDKTLPEIGPAFGDRAKIGQ